MNTLNIINNIEFVYKNSSAKEIFKLPEMLTHYSIFEEILKENFKNEQFMIRLLVSLKFEKIDANTKCISIGKKGSKCYFLLEGSVAKIANYKKSVMITIEEYYSYLFYLLKQGHIYLVKKTLELNQSIYNIEFSFLIERFLKNLSETDDNFLEKLKGKVINKESVCDSKDGDSILGGGELMSTPENKKRFHRRKNISNNDPTEIKEEKSQENSLNSSYTDKIELIKNKNNSANKYNTSGLEPSHKNSKVSISSNKNYKASILSYQEKLNNSLLNKDSFNLNEKSRSLILIENNSDDKINLKDNKNVTQNIQSLKANSSLVSLKSTTSPIKEKASSELFSKKKEKKEKLKIKTSHNDLDGNIEKSQDSKGNIDLEIRNFVRSSLSQFNNLDLINLSSDTDKSSRGENSDDEYAEVKVEPLKDKNKDVNMHKKKFSFSYSKIIYVNTLLKIRKSQVNSENIVNENDIYNNLSRKTSLSNSKSIVKSKKSKNQNSNKQTIDSNSYRMSKQLFEKKFAGIEIKQNKLNKDDEFKTFSKRDSKNKNKNKSGEDEHNENSRNINIVKISNDLNENENYLESFKHNTLNSKHDKGHKNSNVIENKPNILLVKASPTNNYSKLGEKMNKLSIIQKSKKIITKAFIETFLRLVEIDSLDSKIDLNTYMNSIKYEFKTLEKAENLSKIEYFDFHLVDEFEGNYFFGDEYLDFQDNLNNVTYLVTKPSCFLTISKSNYNKYLYQLRHKKKEKILQYFLSHYLFRGFSMIGFFSKFYTFFSKKKILKRELLLEKGKVYDYIYLLYKGEYQISTDYSLFEVCKYIEYVTKSKLNPLNDLDCYSDKPFFHLKSKKNLINVCSTECFNMQEFRNEVFNFDVECLSSEAEYFVINKSLFLYLIEDSNLIKENMQIYLNKKVQLIINNLSNLLYSQIKIYLENEKLDFEIDSKNKLKKQINPKGKVGFISYSTIENPTFSFGTNTLSSGFSYDWVNKRKQLIITKDKKTKNLENHKKDDLFKIDNIDKSDGVKINQINNKNSINNNNANLSRNNKESNKIVTDIIENKKVEDKPEKPKEVLCFNKFDIAKANSISKKFIATAPYVNYNLFNIQEFRKEYDIEAYRIRKDLEIKYKKSEFEDNHKKNTIIRIGNTINNSEKINSSEVILRKTDKEDNVIKTVFSKGKILNMSNLNLSNSPTKRSYENSLENNRISPTKKQKKSEYNVNEELEENEDFNKFKRISVNSMSEPLIINQKIGIENIKEDSLIFNLNQHESNHTVNNKIGEHNKTFKEILEKYDHKSIEFKKAIIEKDFYDQKLNNKNSKDKTKVFINTKAFKPNELSNIQIRENLQDNEIDTQSKKNIKSIIFDNSTLFKQKNSVFITSKITTQSCTNDHLNENNSKHFMKSKPFEIEHNIKNTEGLEYKNKDNKKSTYSNDFNDYGTIDVIKNNNYDPYDNDKYDNYLDYNDIVKKERKKILSEDFCKPRIVSDNKNSINFNMLFNEKSSTIDQSPKNFSSILKKISKKPIKFLTDEDVFFLQVIKKQANLKAKFSHVKSSRGKSLSKVLIYKKID